MPYTRRKSPVRDPAKVSYIRHHLCGLEPSQVQREFPMSAPFAPCHVKFLYGLKGWAVASDSHPNCRAYLRSDCAIYKEQTRHLRSPDYEATIHPFSRFAIARQFVVCALWLVVFITDPFYASFLSSYLEEKTKPVRSSVFQLAYNCLFLADMVLQFFLGYSIDRTKEIVLDKRRIRSRYLRGYFVYDLIPAVCGIVCTIMDLAFPETAHTWIHLPQWYSLRFVRIHTMSRFFRNILNLLRVPESIARCTTLALVMTIIIHWWTCALYLFPVVCYYLGHPFDHSWVLQGVLATDRTVANVYIECLLCTVSHFFGAGKSNITTKNPIERFILALILMCGITSHIYIIAIILHLFGTINVSQTKYEELMYQVNEYMVTKKLPPELRKRLSMYYEHRFQKHYFTESKILDSLSEHLRLEVRLNGCRNLINKVKLFQGCSKETIGAMVSMFKQEIFLPNDAIIKPDMPSERVYFISFGTVAVYLPSGKEIYHMEDGHNFGEVDVVLHLEDFITLVKAVEITEVYYLDKKDFWFIMASQPDIADTLQKSALTKVEVYRAMMAESDETLVDASEILTMLRKGRILDRRRPRK